MNEPMNKRDKKLQEILDWSKGNDDVRIVMLTSSLANLSAPVDDFSDLDIELVFEDIDFYQNTGDWIGHFGREHDENGLPGSHDRVVHRQSASLEYHHQQTWEALQKVFAA